ncbi:MAG: sodium:alanine symporter family protein [Bryobacterales bacterium]|nr:sodium:alanine symporter family protein [Bryobacterales bacterium]
MQDLLQSIGEINSAVNAIVWGPPLMILLVGVGILLTFATGGIQFRKLSVAFREVLGKLFDKNSGTGSVTPFQALSTALASTVGVGNIAGVATAIFLGGPGALFWLLVSGLFGMATKFSEIVIALHYRERDAGGVMRGGAMYVLSKGLNMPRLGGAFALLTALAAFGIGNMVQANSVADAVFASYSVPRQTTAIVLCILVGMVVLGGIQRIAQLTTVLVPFMCVCYLGGALFIVFRFSADVPETIALVFNSAFSGHAAVGGFAGATIMQALRMGIARGLFSNEAGLGSAAIVHASASTDHPVRQGLYGIFEVFVDTIVVCLLTGLVILLTGAWTTGVNGAVLSAKAFEIGLPGVWGHLVVSTGLITFAFSTIVGWAFYGETGVTYLFGTRAQLPYRLLWILFVYLGATGSLHLVWGIADTLNGLMAIPNLIAVLLSIGLLRRLIKEFFAQPR